MKALILNGFLVLVGILSGLLVAELLLRWSIDSSEFGLGGIVQSDDALGWRYIPGAEQWYRSPGEFRVHIFINEHGIRGSYTDTNLPNHLILGDSFVAALQVSEDETFASIVRGEVAQSQSPVDIIAAGFTGYGTDQQLRWYRDEGTTHRPCSVTLAFYLGNDVLDNDYQLAAFNRSTFPPKPFYELVNGRLQVRAMDALHVTQRTPSTVSLVRRHVGNTHLFRLLSGMRAQLEGTIPTRWILSIVGTTIDTKGYSPAFDLFNPSAPPAWDRAWNLTEHLLAEMRAAVEGDGASFLIVALPHPLQVHTDWFEARKAIYPSMRSIRWDMNQPNRKLETIANRLGIDYLDTTWLLKAYVREHNSYIYFARDGHLTVEGNRVVGQYISDWLLARDRLTCRKGGNQP